MNDAIYRKMYRVFEDQNGYAETKDLTASGVHTTHIKQLEETGSIFKLKRGLYRLSNYDLGPHEKLIDASKTVPNGIICLHSALSYHELITSQSRQYNVALHRNDTKIRLPEDSPIKLLYFSDRQYHEGIDHIDMNGHRVKIYDKEKTLCDSARYQNKIGKDIVKEGFKTYLEKPYREIEKLLMYAEQTRVKSIVSNYVDMLS
ncbi:type IV toxin-antitoxin system AbiEi family antitoxin domain-containing protein [Lentibacillus sp.]|uniref:type IV toxin-antitoxin system AbiEi family antitoxin domain-containing protein n=1 Tax=Lentibacillus sp. TaxID=1925746 RepID=UPI002B4B688F|nr:type IV toxin-antitoxin system AbiEi family antitoxin domain-containing protein [Lentibacillus sp.]HLS08455.1 type IV toxin-antitoxin system AbiEi family antitoxin domain-containing protein [Lentibacillus sp.]